MSIDVTIRNRQLIKKPLELQDLTLGKYACCSLDEYGRNTGEIKDGYHFPERGKDTVRIQKSGNGEKA